MYPICITYQDKDSSSALLLPSFDMIGTRSPGTSSPLGIDNSSVIDTETTTIELNKLLQGFAWLSRLIEHKRQRWELGR